jgi:hypothetical protein
MPFKLLVAGGGGGGTGIPWPRPSYA